MSSGILSTSNHERISFVVRRGSVAIEDNGTTLTLSPKASTHCRVGAFRRGKRRKLYVSGTPSSGWNDCPRDISIMVAWSVSYSISLFRCS